MSGDSWSYTMNGYQGVRQILIIKYIDPVTL